MKHLKYYYLIIKSLLFGSKLLIYFFKLDPTKTRVKSNIKFIANPNRIDGPHSLELDGRMLKLISAEIDNSEIDLNQININTEGLSISSEFIPQSGFYVDF